MYMFNVGSPDVVDAQEAMLDDPYFAHLALQDAVEREPTCETDQYSSSGGRSRARPGVWYAIAGGEHEGAWLSTDYSADILPYVEGFADVRC